MASAVLGIAASAKRCQLPLHPLFFGHPVLGETIVTEAPGDLSTVYAWPDECGCILTVGHDFQTDGARIFSRDGSHVVVGVLGAEVKCDYLSRSQLRCCLVEKGALLAVSFAPLLVNGRGQPDISGTLTSFLRAHMSGLLPYPSVLFTAMTTRPLLSPLLWVTHRVPRQAESGSLPMQVGDWAGVFMSLDPPPCEVDPGLLRTDFGRNAVHIVFLQHASHDTYVTISQLDLYDLLFFTSLSDLKGPSLSERERYNGSVISVRPYDGLIISMPAYLVSSRDVEVDVDSVWLPENATYAHDLRRHDLQCGSDVVGLPCSTAISIGA